MHVTSLGAAREFQEGIAVDPLLVGCGLKTHDVDPNEVWKALNSIFLAFASVNLMA